MSIRNMISIIFVLAFTLVLHVSFLHANGSPQWVTGEVASVVEKQDSGLISLKLPDGELVSIISKSDLLKGINIGDIVTVQIIEGSAQIIQLAQTKPSATPEPEKRDKGVQWVPGEVVSIQKGATDSLLSIRMWDGTVFNVASSNDNIHDVKVGDYVIAKVLNGWAQAVDKKER